MCIDDDVQRGLYYLCKAQDEGKSARERGAGNSISKVYLYLFVLIIVLLINIPGFYFLWHQSAEPINYIAHLNKTPTTVTFTCLV